VIILTALGLKNHQIDLFLTFFYSLVSHPLHDVYFLNSLLNFLIQHHFYYHNMARLVSHFLFDIQKNMKHYQQ